MSAQGRSPAPRGLRRTRSAAGWTGRSGRSTPFPCRTAQTGSAPCPNYCQPRSRVAKDRGLDYGQALRGPRFPAQTVTAAAQRTVWRLHSITQTDCLASDAFRHTRGCPAGLCPTLSVRVFPMPMSKRIPIATASHPNVGAPYGRPFFAPGLRAMRLDHGHCPTCA